MEIKIPKEKQEFFIKTFIWNSIIEVFKAEKNIDITPYLISVQLRDDTLLIKTTKPIINSEALIYDDKIKQSFNKKVKNMGINGEKFKLKYI